MARLPLAPLVVVAVLADPVAWSDNRLTVLCSDHAMGCSDHIARHVVDRVPTCGGSALAELLLESAASGVPVLGLARLLRRYAERR